MRPRLTTYILATLILLLLFAPAPVYALGMAKIVVKVVDETGAPVDKAHLNIRFSSNSKSVQGVTDEFGIFEAKAVSNDGVVLGDIKKDGYYMSGFAHSFYVTSFGMWQPWSKKLTVVMRQVIKPVPMYVRNKYFEFPAINTGIGFDLIKSDLVAPYGQGVQSDFIFNAEINYNNISDFSAAFTMTFTNKHDGIQLYKEDPGGDFNVGSLYRLPRVAPADGYQASWSEKLSTSSLDYYAQKMGDENYFYRVRSEVDHEGKLIRAMYGKIRGKILISPRKNNTIKIKLNYYLNPDYTRNLEFDPNRNLFTSLPESEGTGLP